ncbi:MAG TPA: hypothetical protein VMA73_10205 [Streptosporangiaceae bacterium]|nr:hypothetical protein [Streptosporangiaceae bacterium]
MQPNPASIPAAIAAQNIYPGVLFACHNLDNPLRRVGAHQAGPAGAGAQDNVTARPGRLIVPGGQYHVMLSITSRPARTGGSLSASCRDRFSSSSA